jgi:RNA polymerase sigma-70 factor, ECF subfamily
MTLEERAGHEMMLSSAHRDFESGMNKYSFYKIHDQALGEDLVQDAFLKTWNYLLKGGKIETVKSFLYHILNNLIVDQYRKQKHKTDSLDELIDAGFEPSWSESERQFDIFDGKAASLLINDLPLIYQAIMRMRYIQDLSLEEMSVITGQSKNTIAVKLHRGLGKLKSLYMPVPVAAIAVL